MLLQDGEIISSSGKRVSVPQTRGQLYYLCCDELEDICFAEAILLILDCMKESFTDESALSEEMVQSLLDRVVNNPPTFLNAFNPINSDAS